MTFLFYISLLCYLAGALSFQKPKPGYLLGCAGAICSLAFACSAWSRSVTIIHYRLTAGIDMTLGIDHLSALFLLIAALSWIALAIYSIDYSALYPQKKLVLGFNAAIAGMQAQAYLDTMRAIYLADVLDILPQVRVPALIIAGDKDHRIPPNAPQVMVQGIAGARLVTLPGAGHLSNLDSPEAFNRTVLDFLHTLPKEASTVS